MKRQQLSGYSEVIQVGDNAITISYIQVGDEVGKGGYSTCYQARKYKGFTNEFLGEEAIIKILNSISDQKNPIAYTYENQVRALRMLNGEHSSRFVRCLTHWNTSVSKHYCFLLEKCTYGSLDSLMEYLKVINKELTELEVLFFFREILMAVSIMHNLKMIHLDLKLQNILISQAFEIKLIDFGITKIGVNGADPFQNKYEGTPYFISPQIIQRKNYSYQVDLWAIGVILYYLIYMEFPFKGDSKELERAICQNQPNFKQKKGFSKQLIDIANKLLTKDKQKRPSANQLLRAKIFQRLQQKKEKDIHKRIEEKYKEYFAMKSKKKYQWKKKIDKSKLNISFPANTTEQQRKEIEEQIKLRSTHTQKVKIIHLVHNPDYGFFFLLSNLSLIGYFNDCTTLRFSPSIISTSHLTNHQAILGYMYAQHFKQQMKKGFKFNPDVQYDEPQCNIKKVVLVNHDLYVRLSNNALQVFFGEKIGNLLEFPSQIQFNSNTSNPRQITILEGDEKYTYSDYAAVLSPPHNQRVQKVKKVIEVMLKDSQISLEQLQLRYSHA